MKKILTQISPYLTPILIVTTIILAYNVYVLPKNIANEINKVLNFPTMDSIKDTVRVVTIKTARIQTTGNFIYFDGKITSKSRKLIENYTYDLNYPSEIFDGYIYSAESTSGGKYYLWSNNNTYKLQRKITGWFMTDNLSKFQCDKEYLQVLYPIAEKKIKDDIK